MGNLWARAYENIGRIARGEEPDMSPVDDLPDAAGTIPIPDPDTAAATARELVEERIKLLEAHAANARQFAANDMDMARRRVARAEQDERAAAGLREYLKTMEG